MNRTFLIGRLTADPELKRTQGGKDFCRFKLAVDRLKREDGADFISCTAWSKTADNMCKYLKKGAKVAVVGRIQTGSYEKDGRTIYTTDVIVSELEFLEKKSAEGAPAESFVPVEGEIDDSELPF